MYCVDMQNEKMLHAISMETNTYYLQRCIYYMQIIVVLFRYILA